MALVVSHCGFNLHSLNDKQDWAPFHVLTWLPYVFLVKCLFKFLAYFYILLLSFVSYFYILHIGPLSDFVSKYFCSHEVYCLYKEICSCLRRRPPLIICYKESTNKHGNKIAWVIWATWGPHRTQLRNAYNVLESCPGRLQRQHYTRVSLLDE